jgi:hypothetical protein
MSKFGVRTPHVSNKLNSLCKDPNSNSCAVFEVEVWTTDTANMVYCSSFDNDISSVAKEQSYAEDVLAVGMLVTDVLVLADDCTPYKCCIIYSLTSYLYQLIIRRILTIWMFSTLIFRINIEPLEKTLTFSKTKTFSLQCLINAVYPLPFLCRFL